MFHWKKLPDIQKHFVARLKARVSVLNSCHIDWAFYSIFNASFNPTKARGKKVYKEKELNSDIGYAKFVQ